MATTNLETVKDVLEAIRAQDADKASRYVDLQFVQHFPYTADGVAGLRQYIEASTSEQLRLKIVRTLEDGAYVLTQLKSETSGEDMFAVYRLQDGFIAEHWAFSSPDAPPNKSGHTQLDGPTKAKHLEDTEKNKAFVRRYYETFHLAGDRSRNSEFFTGDRMVRHEPGVRDGLGEFLDDVEGLMQHRTIDEIKLLLGHGDVVFVAAKGTHEGKPCVYIDLYRVEDQKLVEHWGFSEMVPPEAERKNQNGVL